MREEDIRLGLAGRRRPHHSIQALLRPLGDPPELPIAGDGTALPWEPPPAPRIHRALLMAGGRGARLAPLTDTTPKPLLRVEGQPLLHRLLAQARDAGISRCFVSVQHLAGAVKRSVGDGTRWGMDIRFLEESEPLGTAGALGLVPVAEEPLLVMNGDVLTDVNLVALFAWHARHRNKVTVATHLHEVHVPFGLAHFDGQRLERLEEKPTLRMPVNAGVYLFEPEVLAGVPRGQPHDMVSWINALSTSGAVGHFPIVERWHDIGSMQEYERLAGT